MKLNLGCGRSYKKECINYDNAKKLNLDKVVDLEKNLLQKKI